MSRAPDPPSRPAPTVWLDLSAHCIETAARREHRRLVQRALQSEPPGPTLQRQIELLGQFLARTDFRQLRARRPRLAGGQPVRVELRPGASSTVELRIAQPDDR